MSLALYKEAYLNIPDERTHSVSQFCFKKETGLHLPTEPRRPQNGAGEARRGENNAQWTPEVHPSHQKAAHMTDNTRQKGAGVRILDLGPALWRSG